MGTVRQSAHACALPKIRGDALKMAAAMRRGKGHPLESAYFSIILIMWWAEPNLINRDNRICLPHWEWKKRKRHARCCERGDKPMARKRFSGGRRSPEVIAALAVRRRVSPGMGPPFRLASQNTCNNARTEAEQEQYDNLRSNLRNVDV